MKWGGGGGLLGDFQTIFGKIDVIVTLGGTVFFLCVCGRGGGGAEEKLNITMTLIFS